MVDLEGLEQCSYSKSFLGWEKKKKSPHNAVFIFIYKYLQLFIIFKMS